MDVLYTNPEELPKASERESGLFSDFPSNTSIIG
jgi:hypothetical protein